MISGCQKPECKTGSDCSSRPCTISSCQDSKCNYVLKRNCCGNHINETTEDNKPGNKCTCPQDYGTCEGKGKIKVGSRTEDAVYVHYYCSAENKCIFGADPNDVTNLNFLDSVNDGFLKASSIVKYNKPFDVNADSIELKVSLDDANKALVFPVKLTKVKLLFYGESSRAEQLIAEETLNSALNSVGGEANIKLLLNLNYRPQQLEESGTLRYSLDYTYTKQVVAGRASDGTALYNNELVRATFTAPSKPVIFIRSGTD